MTKIPEKLRAKWAKKLSNSGFEDIENKDGSLKAEVDPRTVAYAMKIKDSREAYQSVAREFLHKHRFSIREDYAIWEGHCNGLSFRKMASMIGITFYQVRMTINKFQKMAGLKK